ncbi:MAG: MATE family efflux transporter [Parvibaculum sp.]|uniref:MATE family efflux transporter n=1 Tax=Parvibaculum sp. TaxID=2024848 RepID=UPI0025D6B56B|nr:MATE family efflux transporter [Parvibaculum sp.]MCE9650030.1 MATE family efflux transporter [Parvibaculum sp.]
MTEILDAPVFKRPFEAAPLPPVNPRQFIEEARELARLAGPIVVTQLAQMGVGTIDVLLLGAYSKDALAASALGLSLYYAMWVLAMGPAIAVSPMIAHILGAKRSDTDGVRKSVRMAVWAILLIMPFQLAFLWFAGDMLAAMGQPPALAADAGLFVRALAVGFVFTALFNVLRGYATSLSRPNAPLIVMGLMIVFNAVLAYALIFGHFGAPRLGLLGAGIASASSFAFSFFAMLAIIFLTPDLAFYRIFHRFTEFDWTVMKEVVRLGMPISMTIIFEAMFFNAGTMIMGYFGTDSVAAHQVALNVVALCFMVPLGIATAATVRIGLAAGAEDRPRIRRAGLAAMGMSLSFMALMGVVLFVFAPHIIGFYIDRHDPKNAGVIANAILFLRIGAAFQIFDTMQVVASLSLRGLKDANGPMWIAGGSYWLIGFPLALLLAFHFEMQGAGVWIAFVISLAVAALAMSWRFVRLSDMAHNWRN